MLAAATRDDGVVVASISFTETGCRRCAGVGAAAGPLAAAECSTSGQNTRRRGEPPMPTGIQIRGHTPRP